MATYRRELAVSLSKERSRSSSSSTSSPTEKKSADFSISAILSDGTGGSSSRKTRGTPVSARGRTASSSVVLSPTGLSVPMSTPTHYSQYSSPHSSSHPNPCTSVTTPTAHWAGSLNQSLSSSPFNMGLLLLSSSPVPSEVTRGTQERQDIEDSEKEAAEDRLSCNDSLGMLSTVALYHSELSGGEGKEEGEARTTSVVTTVSDGVAQMRLASSSDTIDTTLSADDQRSTPPPPPSPSYHTSKARKGTTPFILRRNNKRRRQLTETFAQSCDSLKPSNTADMSPTENSSAPLDVAFHSPTSNKRSPCNTNLSFSPSIFLSRPDNASTTSNNRSVHTVETHSSSHSTTADGLPVSEEAGVEQNKEEETSSTTSTFATSTPIKHDKENATRFQLSPTTLSSGERGFEVKRPRLGDTPTYETSSGSDSEVPVKKSHSRSRALRHRTKARAQLSPLLENACSPIAKSENRPPSSLLMASYPTSSSAADSPDSKEPVIAQKSQQLPLTPTALPPPPLSLSYPQVPPPIPFPFSCNPLPTQLPHQPNLCLGMMPVVTNPLFTIPAVSPLSPAHTPYFLQAPRLPVITTCSAAAGLLQQAPNSFFPYSNTPHHPYNYPPGSSTTTTCAENNTSQKWGGSPFSAHMEKTGQIQSVPPWFIFEQNRPEGKRLRLTEAINKSLSETPSHNPKLPVGWTKYACGQTDDQISLTQKARLFLQSGRRHLTFDNINT